MTEVVDQPTAVREGEQLDVDRLKAFVQERLGQRDGPLEVRQFPSGYSNLTYSVRCGDQEWVLRRPPFGNSVKSAHDMGREYRVLSALHPVYARAPEPIVNCDDESVLGAPFYIMRRVRGVILRRRFPEQPKMDSAARTALCRSFVENLIELHALDYEAAGLGDLGKPEGYVHRQITGWISRYEKAATKRLDVAERVAEWLAGNEPPDSGTALIHNDYKFDNLVLDPADPTRVIGVLDWEMCTLGDPLMDIGSALGYWVQADDSDVRRAFVTGPTDQPGLMTRGELYAFYAERSGRQLPDPLFYYVYGLFKLAVIVQQIYKRFAMGQSKDPRFADLGHVFKALCVAGTEAMDSGHI